jgi:glycine betaine/proline transport system ATP-binding protein
MHTISIADLDIIFGTSPARALGLLDQGLSRQQIKEKTGHIVGVNQANLSIHQGEIFVLMGLSGSGKSTLLRAINGLMPISRGSINLMIDGPRPEHFSIADADAGTLRHLRTRHVAMVFQKNSLLPWKTVLENVGLGLEIAGVKKIERDQRARETLELVGLGSWALQYPADLSGGMQQRVGLARALATKAPILLMDEPFSALDPVLKNHLQQELLRLQKSLQKTILFVTHDLDEALKIGTRIAIMQEGKIIQIGTPEDVVARPKSQYVKDFVQNIDQTRLLRARAIMTSIGELKYSNDHMSVFLDQSGVYRCLLDENGRPRRSVCGDLEGRIVPWTLFQSGSFNENDIILGHEHLTIKDVIGAVGRTKRPMIIQDKSGKMVGAVTTDSIMTALSTK